MNLVIVGLLLWIIADLWELNHAKDSTPEITKANHDTFTLMGTISLGVGFVFGLIDVIVDVILWWNK